MTDDEKEKEALQALADWRPRWAFFALVWVGVVALLATVLWSWLEGLGERERVLVFALMAVIPPALDYFFSLGIARLLGPRLQRRP